MDSLRDWGYAKDYVECMWLIMQQEKPEDFVIATGVQHTVRDFTEKAFACLLYTSPTVSPSAGRVPALMRKAMMQLPARCWSV